MGFSMSFETCNAAFGEPGDLHQFYAEAERLLAKAAAQVRQGSAGAACMDINGNKVGEWSLDHGCRCPIPEPQPVKPAPRLRKMHMRPRKGEPTRAERELSQGKKPPVHCSCCGRLVATWTRCDACGCVYCGSCASVPDEGGNDCAEPGCNLYGVSR